MGDKNFDEWVNSALKRYDLDNYQILDDGQTKKGDGYVGDINFLTATALNKRGMKETFYFAVKSSKQSEKLREAVPIKDAFLKEAFIYDVVKAAFEKFLSEKLLNGAKGLKKEVDILPFCYATCTTEPNEFLVFENLRVKGFDLWDKTVPLPPKHVRLVLEAYGQWHALSMALKTQKPDVFNELTKNNINMFTRMMVQSKCDIQMAREFENAKNMAVNDNEQDILELLKLSDARYILADMLFEEPDHQVILHGDCWSSNFMFKSEDDRLNPSEVRVLDWQCSGLGSPVFDLSHFIYCCCDTGKYMDVKELLKIYYSSLSKYLILLGCSPHTVFSFDNLVQHWKKFSYYGMWLSCLVIKACLMPSDQSLDLQESAEKGQDVTEHFNIPLKDKEVYVSRVRNNFLHYCQNVK